MTVSGKIYLQKSLDMNIPRAEGTFIRSLLNAKQRKKINKLKHNAKQCKHIPILQNLSRGCQTVQLEHKPPFPARNMRLDLNAGETWRRERGELCFESY